MKSMTPSAAAGTSRIRGIISRGIISSNGRRKVILKWMHRGPDSFDIATILFLLHEIPYEKQVLVLNEALRVARRAIVVDSRVPLPKNLHGIALRIVEALGGPGHYRSFADYLAANGISGVLADSRVRASVAGHSVFWHGCREMVVLERQVKTSV